MTSTAIDAPAPARTEIIALQILVAVLLAIRLWTQMTGGLVGDEAYYWMWGQHPALSYFDHPPLHAWLLGLVSLVSWHPFAVRVLTWASLAVVLSIFWAWSRRLSPAAPRLWFWRATAIYLASPMFFVMMAVAYNDHLLVALVLSSIHCFAIFVERSEGDLPAPNRWLFAAAALLGLAVLTKYNALFVGIGFAAAFLVRARLRPLLLTPAPWLAAALSVAIQAPVLWWNLVEGGASFRFHLEDRWTGGLGLHWANLFRFGVFTFLLWAPFLTWPLIRLLRARPVTAFEAGLRPVVLWTLATSTLVFVLSAIVRDAYFYWNIVALAAVTPLLAGFANQWLRALHYLLGLLVAVAAMIHFAIMPIPILLGGTDGSSAINYNWDTVASHMQAQIAGHPEALVAGTRFTTTSQLGFALGTADVVKLSPEHSQWDYWQEGRDFTGQSALILVDEPDGSPVLAFLEAHFETLEVADSFTIEQLGRPIYAWRILLGRDWTP